MQRAKLERRKKEFARDSQEIKDLESKWQGAAQECIELLNATQRSGIGPPAPPSPEAAAQELALTGALRLPGCYSPDQIASLVDDVSKIIANNDDDVYTLFYHDAETKGHIGCSRLCPVRSEDWNGQPKAKTQYDVDPILAAIHPSGADGVMRLPIDQGWWVMALPEQARHQPRKWHIDGFDDDKMYHFSKRTMVTLTVLTPTTERNGGTAFLQGSHRWLAKHLRDHYPQGASAPTLATLFKDTAELHESCPMRTVFGRPGDVWLFHPWTVHSISANSSSVPRLACNPHVLKKGGLQMDPPGASRLEECAHSICGVALRLAGHAQGDAAADDIALHVTRALLSCGYPRVRVILDPPPVGTDAPPKIKWPAYLQEHHPTLLREARLHSHHLELRAIKWDAGKFAGSSDLFRDGEVPWRNSLAGCSQLVLLPRPDDQVPTQSSELEAAVLAAVHCKLEQVIVLLPVGSPIALDNALAPARGSETGVTVCELGEPIGPPAHLTPATSRVFLERFGRIGVARTIDVRDVARCVARLLQAPFTSARASRDPAAHGPARATYVLASAEHTNLAALVTIAGGSAAAPQALEANVGAVEDDVGALLGTAARPAELSISDAAACEVSLRELGRPEDEAAALRQVKERGTYRIDLRELTLGLAPGAEELESGRCSVVMPLDGDASAPGSAFGVAGVFSLRECAMIEAAVHSGASEGRVSVEAPWLASALWRRTAHLWPHCRTVAGRASDKGGAPRRLHHVLGPDEFFATSWSMVSEEALSRHTFGNQTAIVGTLALCVKTPKAAGVPARPWPPGSLLYCEADHSLEATLQHQGLLAQGDDAEGLVLLTPLIAVPALNAGRAAFRAAVDEVVGAVAKHKAGGRQVAPYTEKRLSIRDLFPAQQAFNDDSTMAIVDDEADLTVEKLPLDLQTAKNNDQAQTCSCTIA